MRYPLWILLFSLLLLSSAIWGYFFIWQYHGQTALPLFSTASLTDSTSTQVESLPQKKPPTSSKKPSKPVTKKQPVFEKAKKKTRKVAKKRLTSTNVANLSPTRLIQKNLATSFSRQQLSRWNAEIVANDANNTIRIYGNELSFKGPKSLPSNELSDTLQAFLPSYFHVLSQPHISNHIYAILVESHTTSIWKSARTKKESFDQNKLLSQLRARSVEQYIKSMPELEYLKDWLDIKLQSKGRSFESPIRLPNGDENVHKSSRLEFRIILNQ